MIHPFSRTELLLGSEGLERLKRARVAVFGIGGVGSYVVEALARSGIGALDLVDHDEVALSNINRQLIATYDTVGRKKVEIAKQRVLCINPDIEVRMWPTFYHAETANQFDFSQYDYIVDAIDTVTGKIELIMQAQRAGVPIISSMGAGNKLDATAFRVADIYQTSVCPLARVMRRELRKRGVTSLKVVYSEEVPVVPFALEETETKGQYGKQAPGSIAFVPSVAGLIAAGEVIKDLAGVNHTVR